LCFVLCTLYFVLRTLSFPRNQSKAQRKKQEFKAQAQSTKYKAQSTKLILHPCFSDSSVEVVVLSKFECGEDYNHLYGILVAAYMASADLV